MVDRPGRGDGRRWFLIGAIIGGVVSGSVVAILSLLIPTVPLSVSVFVIALMGVLVVLRDLGIAAIPFPQRPRQVPDRVLRLPLPTGAWMFGFEMGTGARTHLTGAAPYIAIAASLLGGLLPAVWTGLGFGLGRGLISYARRWSGHEVEWDRWTTRYGRVVVPVTSAVISAAAACVAVSLAS